MSEPTKEAIEEAAELRAKFCGNTTVVIFADELASIIAHVRKQARDDALEEAAKHFLRNGPYVEWFAETIADDLRAMKDKSDGEA
jgi:hypothetical protein